MLFDKKIPKKVSISSSPASVVVLPDGLVALCVLVADGAVGAQAGLVLAAHLLVAHETSHALPAVEGAVGVDALRVGHAVTVVHCALVNVVTDLALPRSEKV